MSKQVVEIQVRGIKTDKIVWSQAFGQRVSNPHIHAEFLVGQRLGKTHYIACVDHGELVWTQGKDGTKEVVHTKK